jgi:hypothetical protein
MGLIRSQVKDRPRSHARTLQVYGDGHFRHLQGASKREEVLLAELRVWSLPTTGGNLEKGPRDGLYMPTLCWSTS